VRVFSFGLSGWCAPNQPRRTHETVPGRCRPVGHEFMADPQWVSAKHNVCGLANLKIVQFYGLSIQLHNSISFSQIRVHFFGGFPNIRARYNIWSRFFCQHPDRRAHRNWILISGNPEYGKNRIWEKLGACIRTNKGANSKLFIPVWQNNTLDEKGHSDVGKQTCLDVGIYKKENC